MIKRTKTKEYVSPSATVFAMEVQHVYATSPIGEESGTWNSARRALPDSGNEYYDDNE